jgi:hypothetical protein
MIAPAVLEKTRTYWLSLLDHGQYTIGGVNKTVAIYDSDVAGSKINIYLVIPDTEQGDMTDIKLIDKDGNLFADSPDTINKLGGKVLLVAFQFNMIEV